MKKIKFKIDIKTTYEGYCPLEDLWDCLGITEEQWNTLTQDKKEELMCSYYEDEIWDIFNNCHTINWEIKIKE